MTDGASIPDWAQSVMGMPWDKAHQTAAEMHDRHCGKRAVSWREMRLMFHDALIDLGVNEYNAKLTSWGFAVAPTCRTIAVVTFTTTAAAHVTMTFATAAPAVAFRVGVTQEPGLGAENRLRQK